MHLVLFLPLFLGPMNLFHPKAEIKWARPIIDQVEPVRDRRRQLFGHTRPWQEILLMARRHQSRWPLDEAVRLRWGFEVWRYTERPFVIVLRVLGVIFVPGPSGDGSLGEEVGPGGNVALSGVAHAVVYLMI
jgi:hypothetical protein